MRCWFIVKHMEQKSFKGCSGVSQINKRIQKSYFVKTPDDGLKPRNKYRDFIKTQNLI